MDQTQFWQLLWVTKHQSDGDVDRQVTLIQKQLETYPLEEIATFHLIYQTFLGRSNNIHLWRALDALIGFVSDDGFDYFRSWLVAQGEEIFCAVMKNPGRVSEFVNPQKPWQLEDLDYIAGDVYSAQAGRETWDALEAKMGYYHLEGYDWLQPVHGFFEIE